MKNAGATYQRRVDNVCKHKKGRSIEVHVDDSIVKSKKDEDHIEDLDETFDSLWKYRMKINPKKCTFGVRSGKFLGFMISRRGIDANPKKVQAILDLPEPKKVKDIQKLAGKMAALSRFIFRSADKAVPFFKILNGGKDKDFKWEM